MNYSFWSRSMRIAFLGKNKLALVVVHVRRRYSRKNCGSNGRGSLLLCAIMLSWLMNSILNSLLSGFIYASNAFVVWDDLKERFDKTNGSRTLNLHKEINSLTQGTSSMSIYFAKLKGLWNELESLVPPLLVIMFDRGSCDLLAKTKALSILDGVE